MGKPEVRRKSYKILAMPLLNALAAQIGTDPNFVKRIVINAEAGKPATLHVDYFFDGSSIDAVTGAIQLVDDVPPEQQEAYIAVHGRKTPEWDDTPKHIQDHGVDGKR